MKNSEFEKFIKDNIIDEVKINYEMLYEKLKDEQNINPHAVNPLYIKVIEVLK